MRLWIDGQCLQTASRMRGIGRYVTELLRAIAAHHPNVEMLISFNAAMPDEAILAREAVREFIDPKNIHVWHGIPSGGEAITGYTPERQLNEVAISHHVNCLAPDVALSASPFEGVGDNACPLLPGRGCAFPIVSVFYDLIPHRFRSKYLQSSLMTDYYDRRLHSSADFDDNLCISEFSKNELNSVFPGAATENISAGISRDMLVLGEKIASERHKRENFILYVGALDWRKNVPTVINAFVELDRIWPDNKLKFVIAGDAPSILISELVTRWSEMGLAADRFNRLGHVSDEDLLRLYAKTKLVVQPSFMEGFGLTALEATHCGAPVLAARAGALPEVVGSDDLLFDPNSPTELAERIVTLLSDPTATKRTVERTQAHASVFTWQRTAEIAVNRIKQRKRQNRVALSATRRQIADLAGRIRVSHAEVAKTLALAELPKRESSLIVDVTSTALVDHKTGIQRVVKRIAGAMSEIDSGTSRRVKFGFSDDLSGWYETDGASLAVPSRGAKKIVPSPGSIVLMLDSSWGHFELHQKFLKAARLRGCEVYSCLYDTVPIYAQAMCNPEIPTVFTHWIKSALTYSTGFVCISKAVADELLDVLEAIQYPRKMKVGYWQLGADFSEGSKVLGKHPESEVTRARFLMVGTLEPRKGHAVAIDAFEQLWQSGIDAELVIVGKVGWEIAHLAARIRNHPEHGRRLFWHERTSDAQLASLYESCRALIASSYAEGFGLPIVEAGHFGKAVLASDIPVFREVAKGAATAHFFKVGNAKGLSDSVKKFLSVPRRKDVESQDWLNWEGSARQLEDVILNDAWYRVYEPRSANHSGDLSDIGDLRMAAPLPDEQRSATIELVEGPYLDDSGDSWKIVVAVKNNSNSMWSSRGDGSGALSVNLSYHLVASDGNNVRHNNGRTSIPFIHAPGVTIYQSISIPIQDLPPGAAFADIELVQEGVAWFGNPLRVAI